MSNELTFSNVESKKARPADFRHIIGSVFKAENDACWIECRPYLMPPGIDGSAQWDHCEVINIILKHDSIHGGNIATYMVANNISKSALWQPVANCIRRAGFDMQNGRVYGMLEQDESQTV